MSEKVSGNLVIIGGAEDKHGENKILKEVVDIIGGYDAKLVVLTTATEQPETVGNEYYEVFKNLGVNKIEILNINSRNDANKEHIAKIIAEASGIFFTGGDQLRITSILGGTKAYAAMQDAYNNGTVIIGTSAGASVMSSNMIVNGDNNDPARKCTLKMAPGMGLFEEVIIDQHFHQRGRIGRLPKARRTVIYGGAL